MFILSKLFYLPFFLFPLTSLNRYTIEAKGLKFQASSKYNKSVEVNACKKWIEEIQAYIFLI